MEVLAVFGLAGFDVADFDGADFGAVAFGVVALAVVEFGAVVFTSGLPAGFRANAPAGPFAAFFERRASCSPTAELRLSGTPSAPLACALTGILDTRPA
ncbi:hypothetical protein A6A29_27745 [Streptomyces sp. TSRI0281]|nr:hypothetical protein A6A29_27745 [Streptomyces sp. TSRI0281]